MLSVVKLSVVKLSVVKLSVVKLSVIMLNFAYKPSMLNVIMPNGVMLSVMAPSWSQPK
jgi:hypothetical protein